MNIRKARRACEMSAKAYKRPAEAIILKKGTAKVILIREAECTWIAVEGTRPNVKDWFKNFWTRQVDFWGLKAHKGCVSEANALLPLIKPHLKFNETVRITGHSQGGGVAPLLAWALKGHVNVRSGHCFAPMRSLSRKSARLFNAYFFTWYSIARQSDIVPHVPPALRYGNLGHGKFIDEQGALKEGIPSPGRYLREIFRLARTGKISEVWADHNIDKYLVDMRRLSVG